MGLAFSLQLGLVILDICQKEPQPSTYFTLYKSLPGCKMICLRSVWVYDGYKELKSSKRVGASSQSGHLDQLSHSDKYKFGPSF